MAVNLSEMHAATAFAPGDRVRVRFGPDGGPSRTRRFNGRPGVVGRVSWGRVLVAIAGEPHLWPFSPRHLVPVVLYPPQPPAAVPDLPDPPPIVFAVGSLVRVRVNPRQFNIGPHKRSLLNRVGRVTRAAASTVYVDFGDGPQAMRAHELESVPAPPAADPATPTEGTPTNA